MKIKEFKLERLFARYDEKTKYALSQVACEGWSMKEILDMADDECKKWWETLSLDYNDIKGFRPLCEAISRRYETIRPNDIIEVVPEEGIFIYMNTILEPGDEVIVMQPSLPSLYEIPHSMGCKVVRWPLEATSFGWKLNVEFLAEHISPKTKLLVMNIPNNPTGYIPIRPEMERILNLADSNGTWVFSEEMYRGMEHDPAGALPSLADLYPRACVVGGVNRFGLPGTRMGWLVTKNHKLLEECASYRDYTTLCSAAPSQILATIAMRNADYILQRNHKIVLDNLKIAEKFFTRTHKKLFTWHQPDGGSIAFPQLNKKYNVTEMCERAIEDKGLLIIGERAYGLTTNNFRVGLGRRDFPTVLDVFGGIAKEMEKEL